MADPKAFLKLPRIDFPKRPVAERKHDFKDLYKPLPIVTIREQASRCMDCGVPFCQGDTGCPVQNLIPDWNEMVREDRWRDAIVSLHATNNFPEFTGKLCPAPCEQACVLGLIETPVTIKNVEFSIIERAYADGLVQPQPPKFESGKRVAVVGSGPAGLAAAQTLRRAGHGVTLFEKADRIGGLLRYGIPDFKMEKWLIDRRIAQMEAEGVEFRTSVNVGLDVTLEQLRGEYDAVCIAIGAEAPRTMEVPGMDLDGVHYAMEYLTQQNRRIAGDYVPEEGAITAKGKRVVVIGGGDTGSDCLGTAHRQEAAEVYQFILLPEPTKERDPSTPWPYWPLKLMNSHAHEEGGEREWNVIVKGFSGENGRLTKLHAVRVEMTGFMQFEEIPGTEFEFEVDLAIFAIGFMGPKHDGLINEGRVPVDGRGNIASRGYKSHVDGVWAVGDARRGASLIVWAIREGRDAAIEIDQYLTAGRMAAIA